MPRTRSLAWSELKLGVLTISATVIAAVTIFVVTGGRGFFWQRYTLKTRFSNVAGLKPGSPVRLAGVEVGTVNATPLAGDQVEVVFDVNERYRDRITTGSVATLGSVSLLGESAIDIAPSGRGTPIPEWGYVPAGRAPAQFADVTNRASQGIEEISGLIHDVRQGQGTMGKLVTDERLYADMHELVRSAGQLTRTIRDGRGTLGRLVNDPKTAQELEASLGNIERITQELNTGQGTLGRLLKDDALAKSLNETTANLRDVTMRLSRGEGTAGKLLTDQSLFNRLNEVTGRFDQVLTQLTEGQGTAGQLLKDKQLYENMNAAVADLRSLLAAIQKNPKKYLNLKVSIF